VSKNSFVYLRLLRVLIRPTCQADPAELVTTYTCHMVAATVLLDLSSTFRALLGLDFLGTMRDAHVR
jgi:hypothetical protein